jgi:hypothetical protein
MGKYKHTEQDAIDDMLQINKFKHDFELAFRNSMELEVYKDCKSMDYLGYGAKCIYTTKENFMIWLSTEINPNGITTAGEIGRTYTITYEHIWDKNQRKFHAYATSIDSLINKFRDVLHPYERISRDFKFILS